MSLTLVQIEFEQHELTKYALDKTLEHITPNEILVISNKDFVPGSRFVYRDAVNGYTEYNNVMLKEVAEHVTTDFALFSQWDGIAHNRNAWTDEFLKYDYIGAPWPWQPEGKNIGNGGFSLRSKKLLDALVDDRFRLSKEHNYTEDCVIGVAGRPALEQDYGIKFAPTELASKFSFELGTYSSSFGFHAPWNIIYMMTEDEAEHIMHRADFKGWNVWKWHHCLCASIRTGKMDLVTFLLRKMEEHTPEHLSAVANLVESVNPQSGDNITVW